MAVCFFAWGGWGLTCGTQAMACSSHQRLGDTSSSRASMGEHPPLCGLSGLLWAALWLFPHICIAKNDSHAPSWERGNKEFEAGSCIMKRSLGFFPQQHAQLDNAGVAAFELYNPPPYCIINSVTIVLQFGTTDGVFNYFISSVGMVHRNSLIL